MAMDFSNVADDFFVNVNLQTSLHLPDSRETVLHFCENVQKEFRSMTSLYQRESGEFVLEADRDSGSYQWLELHTSRLTAGDFNPTSFRAACMMHRWILERSTYFLGLGGLDVECLDLVMGFNLDFVGNRDAIVAQALLAGSPLGVLAVETGVSCVECEPSVVVSMDDECQVQTRLSIETRGSSYQIRTGRYDEEPISVYFTVRRYPRPGEVFDLKASFEQQAKAAEDLAERVLIPHVIQPIVAAIASEQ